MDADARGDHVTPDFSDALDTFVNVNDPDERQRLEARLLSTAGPG